MYFLFTFLFFQMSGDENPGWLGYIGVYTAQLYSGIIS